MSLFDRIQKRILSEESEASKRQREVAQQNREEAAKERRRKKFGPENPEGKVKFNKNTNQNTQNPSSRTSTPKRGSTTFVPGGQGTLPDFDPETGKTVTDKAGNPLFGKEPPKEKKVKTTYNKKTVTQTPIETSGPLFDQQPTKKGFKSFMKSPAYYAKQREKTKAGRNRYDFIPDKDGKFDFNPETKKSNIEKYARRMLSRKQIDSKSNVPIELTSDDLAKAERDARSKYGGRDGKQMTQSQRNKVLTKIKNTPKAKTMTYLSPAGSGKPVPLKTRRIIKKKPFKTKMDLSKPIKDPWFTDKNDYPNEFDSNKTKSKKIGGKSFEDLMKDNKKKLQQLKNKKLVQSNPIKTGSRVTTGNQIPFVNPPLKTPPKTIPLTQPLKEPRKIKKILSTKTPAYNPYKSTTKLGKVMSALKKHRTTAAIATAIGTGVYLYNRGKNNPKGIVPPPTPKSKIKSAKGVDIKFTLGGGDPSKGYKYAGRKDINK